MITRPLASERIAAIVHARQPLPATDGAAPKPPAPGEIIHLQLAQAQGDDVLAATGDGRSLRLAGLAGLGQELADGDVLLVRVLAASPHLDLEFLGTLSRQERAPLAPPAEPASMRLDQAALRQICWREPNAAALAAAWRVVVYGRWRDDRLAGAVDGGYPALGPARGEQLPVGIDRWTFPIYAWGGQQMLLRLVQSDADDDRAPAHRPAPPLALCLELDLPGLGRVLLLVQWLAGGLQLTLRLRSKTALPAVRERLPELAAALARADLQLHRCRLIHGTQVELLAPGDDFPHGPAAAVPASLFRAAAETLVVLAAGAAQIIPANR